MYNLETLEYEWHLDINEKNCGEQFMSAYAKNC